MMRTFLKWWLIAALAVVVINMLSPALGGQTVKAVKKDNMTTAGRTLCENGEIVIHVATEVPPADVAEVMVHEAVHVLQLRKFRKCEDGVARYQNDKRFALNMEVEAYCIEARLFAPDRNVFLAIMDFVASYLWRTNHANFTSYEPFKAFLVAECNRVHDNVPNVRFITAVDSVATFEITRRTPAIPP